MLDKWANSFPNPQDQKWWWIALGYGDWKRIWKGYGKPPIPASKMEKQASEAN
jgi:hypothetical protein